MTTSTQRRLLDRAAHPIRGLRDDLALRQAPVRERWLDHAAELHARGGYQESRRIVQRVLRRDPGSRRAAFMRTQLLLQPDLDIAISHGREGRLEAQHRILCRLQKRFRNEPEIYLWLAANGAARRQEPAAAWYARRAAELAPDDPAALFRAAWFGRKGDPAASRTYLERVKQLADRSEFVLYREVPYLDGLLAASEGRDTESLILLQRAFRLEPANVGIAGVLASSYIQHNRVEDALDCMAVGLEHHPADDGLRVLWHETVRAT